jgi:glutamate racemase
MFTSSSSSPIGLFDSGLGGLTVYRALKERLPQERFIYIGDTARLPYGTKSPEVICSYAEHLSRRLIEEGSKLLVVACNTATALALPHLKKLWPDVPIFGVIEPCARAAVAATKTGRIIVLATEGTVLSGAYERSLHALMPAVQVESIPSGLLVALAEEGWHEGEEAQSVLRRYLGRITLADYDTLVLGCTHFPLLTSALAPLLPPHVARVDCAQETASAVSAFLNDCNLCTKLPASDKDRFLVTDLSPRFSFLASLFLEEAAPKEVTLLSL